MTKIIKVSMVLIMTSSMLAGGADQVKMYDVKSGKIAYETNGSGNIMGMIQTETVGKKRVIFDKYGVKNLSEENKIEKKTTDGKTEVIKTHTITYMTESMLYQTDFDKQRIIRMSNPMAGMMGAMGGGKNMMKAGEEMMKSMGGKKVGTDKVLGYTCDIWEMMGTKQCLYKGISLKIEMDVMGIKSTTVATKAEFNIDLNKDDFKMPDFPVYDMEGNKLDKSKLDAMDKKAEGKAAQASKDMADLRKRMENAAKSTGIKEGERPTKAQEEKMKEVMIVGMLPRIKQKMLSQEKMMHFAKECLSEADTLKEANECNHKTNAMSGIEEEDFDEWNPKAKKEMLELLDQGFQAMECIKKAQSMDAIQQCTSEE